MTTITVHNSAELSAALTTLSSTGGTILVVNDGTDYSISRSKIGNADSAITITAADPDDPPNFTTVKLTSVQNIVFDGLTFDSSDQTLSENQDKVLQVSSSTNVSFVNNTFTGASTGLVDGTGTDLSGRNLALFRESTGITFSDNTVSNMGFGVTVMNSTGTTISGNDFSHMVFDTIRLTGVVDTLVENNYIHDIYGSSQDINHLDMIQVFSASYNTQNTENLTIRGNLFDTGDGSATQTIFIGNELFASTGVTYKNIVIEDNTIYNGQVNGIVVGGADNVTVSNNTLLWDQDAYMLSSAGGSSSTAAPSIRLTNVTNGTVTDNIASSINAGTATQSGNYIISSTNTGAENYVGNYFVNVTTTGTHDLRDFSLLPGSALSGIGSSATQPASEDDALTAVMRQTVSTSDVKTVIYDATLSHENGVTLDPATTKYIWTLEDGRTVEGAVISVTYDKAGDHVVTLQVITETGESDEISRTSTTKEERLLAVDFNDGLIDDSGNGATLTLTGDTSLAKSLVAEDSGVFHLDSAQKLSISGKQIYKQQTFSLGMTVALDSVGSSGTILSMFNGLGAAVLADGSVKVSVKTTAGWISIISDKGLIDDTAAHRIMFTFDGSGSGDLTLYVDGTAVASMDVTSPMVSTGSYPLVVGGSTLTATLDDLVMLRGAKDAAWVASDAGTVAVVEPVAGEVAAPVAEETVEAAPILPEGLAAGLAAATRLADPGLEVPLLSLSDLLKIDFNGSVLDTSGHAAKLSATGSYAGVEGVMGSGFHLDGSSKLTVDRSASYLGKTPELTLGVSLKLDTAGSSGTFVNIHNGLGMSILSDGSVKVSLNVGGKWVSVTSEAGLVSDTDWHRVVFSYDTQAGGNGLTLYVDGESAGHVDLSGAINWTKTYSLVFGNTFGESLHATIDDISLVSDTVSEATIADDYQSLVDRIAANAHPDQVGVTSVDGNVIGTDHADVMIGTAADEVFFGREGGDTITGGGGADVFVFDRAIDPAHVDHITDFASGDDRILFDADLLGLDAGTTASKMFETGTDATNADTRFVYDEDSGQLWFDADGSGDGDKHLVLKLAAGTALVGHDITLF